MKADRAYEYDIDALIPKAEKEARKKVRASGAEYEHRGGYRHCFFTEYFHKSMKGLAIKAGLRTF